MGKQFIKALLCIILRNLICREESGTLKLHYNKNWLNILKSTSTRRTIPDSWEDSEDYGEFENLGFEIPENFEMTAPVLEPPVTVNGYLKASLPELQVNNQTEQFCSKLGIEDPNSLFHEQKSLESYFTKLLIDRVIN